MGQRQREVLRCVYINKLKNKHEQKLQRKIRKDSELFKLLGRPPPKPFRKNCRAKSLIASQLVYILSPLPTNQQVLDEINNIFYKFLWDWKGDKIKRSIMISDYGNGGLKMIDINSFNKALKLSLVRKYLNNDNSAKWKLLFDFQLQDYGGSEFFRCNLNRKDLSKYINVPDPFIAEIVQIWAEISFDDSVKSIDHLFTLNLWHNSLIKVGNKPIYYKSWSTKGIQKVGH